LKMLLVGGGGKRGNIQRFWGVFAVQTTFLPVGSHEPHQSWRTGVFGWLRTGHQI